MKKKTSPILIYSLVTCSFALFIFLANSPEYESIKRSRYPAMSLEKYDISLYNDYFITKKHNKNLRYDLSIDFWSNKNDEKIKKQTKKAVQKAFKETFIQHSLADPEVKKSFTDLLKVNLLNSFLDKFVRRLRFLKIIHGKFNIRFNFTPTMDNPYSFFEEFSSNQLMIENKSDKLSDYIESEQKELAQSVYDVKISQTDIQDSSELFQFRGGSILIHIEILDMIIDTNSPIPNPVKNAVKGKITFRRYFEINKKTPIDLALHEQNINLGEAQYKTNRNGHGNFITVDVVKKFNLENITPSDSYAHIYFGNIKSESKKRNDIRTGNLNISGNLQYKTGRKSKRFNYEANIKELVYKFGKKSFEKKSKLDIKIKNSVMQSIHVRDDKAIMKKAIKNNLINIYAEQIIERLGLKRFHKNIGKLVHYE